MLLNKCYMTAIRNKINLLNYFNVIPEFKYWICLNGTYLQGKLIIICKIISGTLKIIFKEKSFIIFICHVTFFYDCLKLKKSLNFNNEFQFLYKMLYCRMKTKSFYCHFSFYFRLLCFHGNLSQCFKNTECVYILYGERVLNDLCNVMLTQRKYFRESYNILILMNLKKAGRFSWGIPKHKLFLFFKLHSRKEARIS